MMFPTIDLIEEYLESFEDVVYASLSAATPDIPAVRDTFNRLWDDVSRFGPVLSTIHVPTLGDFQISLPPPPPPPPKSLLERSADWCAGNPWKVVGICVGVAGAGLLVGYGTRRVNRSHRKPRGVSSIERRQVIIVLGGDRPLGPSLILDLEKKGYIVITSVSTSEAVDDLEHKTNGYVRALVLDPTDPDTIPIFLRSLSSTMSRRFPINTGGDPHASPSSQHYIHSVISLLTLSSHSPSLHPMPLEHLPLNSTYLSYLQSTHITPLQVIQALLPLLRTSPARAKDALSNNKGAHSIVVCLPATDTRVGMPFAAAQAMSASATLQGIQVLRREIKLSALSGSDAMKNLRVVVIDVGAIEHSDHLDDGPVSVVDLQKAMDTWTSSEKAAYGSSLYAMSEQSGSSRRPSHASSFVDTVVDVVGGDRTSRYESSSKRLLHRLKDCLRGDRISVGAGARTYKFASTLPTFILDGLISLPHFLVSLRNALLPIPTSRPIIPPSQLATHPQPHGHIVPVNRPDVIIARPDPPVIPDQDEHADHSSEAGSESDIDSNDGSWVSLKEGSAPVSDAPAIA